MRNQVKMMNLTQGDHRKPPINIKATPKRNFRKTQEAGLQVDLRPLETGRS